MRLLVVPASGSPGIKIEPSLSRKLAVSFALIT
jgi:hypothetical protein